MIRMVGVVRLILRVLLAALFLFAGFVHLRDPGLFMPVMPPWIPWHGGCIIGEKKEKKGTGSFSFCEPRISDSLFTR